MTICGTSQLLLAAFSSLQFVSNVNEEWIAVQQQHSSHVQFGHALVDLLTLHSEGKQSQSAHLI